MQFGRDLYRYLNFTSVQFEGISTSACNLLSEILHYHPLHLLPLTLMYASKKVGKTLFKAKFLHVRSWKMIIEPPDHTGNEPTLDIPIRGSGQDIKKDKMVNTCHL